MKLSDPGIIALLTVLGTVAVAGIGGLVNWLVRRQSRPVDTATARKTEAEAVATEVKTARELLQEIKAYFTDRLREQQEDHARELAVLTSQVDELTKRVGQVEAQQLATRVAFRIHRTWDEVAFARLRATDPDYPPPPDVEGL